VDFSSSDKEEQPGGAEGEKHPGLYSERYKKHQIKHSGKDEWNVEH
jgi:hypothetical protein